MQKTVKIILISGNDKENLDKVLEISKAFVDRMEKGGHQTKISPASMGFIVKVLLHNAYDAIYSIAKKPIIILKSNKKNGTVIFSIDDNGCGYGKTTKKLFGGAGSGVNAVKEELDSNGGTIFYKKSSLGGTKVIIKIPATF